jgi:starch synthase
LIAGADFFLMPSLTEPCGLTQMYAQNYGTIPVASRVGGLVDTIVDLDERPADGTGLLGTPDAKGLWRGIERAHRLFNDAPHLADVQQRGMRRDFSWDSVVGEYESLYRE